VPHPFAFFLAKGWETSNLKERNRAVSDLQRNQSNYILLSMVQGRRCLHPTNKDPFAGTLNLGVAST
jgi:hypothetical protein